MLQKLFSKDFTLVIIGQMISLFGNAIIRFALPLYLLNRTGSSALYGTVTACALIPAILLSPVGGVIADRVNKRNIMVVLDFLTAAIIFVFFLLQNNVQIVPILIITLMLFYGIAGVYQPSVQASIPALVNQDQLMTANSIVNTISSFASLIGPVLGGILYSIYGLKPVLWVCMICFFASAMMELFIKIPFQKPDSQGSLFQIVKMDFIESIRLIRDEKLVIGKALLIVCGVNLFLSSMLMIALPYLITEVFALDAIQANQFCGFANGALAAGGLIGGICAGIFADKLLIQKSGNLLIACAISVFPISISLIFCSSGLVNYIILTICCCSCMIVSTIFSVQMMTFFQSEIPQNQIGKVIAVVLTISMCAQPFGNLLYGILFELFRGFEFLVVLLAGFLSLIIALKTRNIFTILR